MRTLGKPYGIKLRCYWEHLRKQLGELFENLEEHDENKGELKILGHSCSQGKG
jgi:hypothetical protein